MPLFLYIPAFTLSDAALQKQNYMLLWDYQDAGFSHYCILTEGENCDACNCLAGQVFPISDARVGENFAPMHSNCNCRVGILDDAGRIAYVISEGKSEKKEEETNWYDAFLRMPQDAKELFLSFVRAQNERLGRKDVAGFLDWLTMGIVSGTWQGYQDRYQELLNDPTLYNFVNYLTSGFADTVKGAIKPEEPLSLQHWLDSLGTVSTAFGAYQAGKSLKGTSTIKSNVKTETKKVLGEIDDVTNGIKYFEDIQLTTEPNTAYFWSGMGEDGAGIAASIAKKNNGATLEMTIDRNAIKIPKWDFDNPDSTKAWQAASESFAKQASGEVKVVLGRNVSPHSIWATQELPLLMKNQNVTKIIKIDPETLKETIIFMR